MERAHDQPPGEAAPEQIELLVHPVDAVEDLLCMFEDRSTGGGQLGRARTTRAVEERHSCGALQLTDLLADRRLREAQVVRRSGERPGVDDRDERRQLPGIGISKGRHEHQVS